MVPTSPDNRGSTVIRFLPDIVFLQIGTNYQAQRGMSPLTVGSAIEDFVRLLHDEYGVRLIICRADHSKAPCWKFNANVRLLAQYLKTVLEPLPFAIYWTHRGSALARFKFLLVL